jgi:hypothetical protein
LTVSDASATEGRSTVSGSVISVHPPAARTVSSDIVANSLFVGIG